MASAWAVSVPAMAVSATMSVSATMPPPVAFAVATPAVAPMPSSCVPVKVVVDYLGTSKGEGAEGEKNQNAE